MVNKGRISKKISENEYNRRAIYLMNRGENYSEQIKGGRKTFFMDNKMYFYTVDDQNINIGKYLTDNQFFSFLGRFSKQLYNRFIKNPKLYDIDISYPGSPISKNVLSWTRIEELEGFYSIDLKSAYWQIANKLGYLNDKMFKKYMLDNDYKQAKRLCISFLGRENKKKYGKNIIIKCETDILYKIYQNIRYELHGIIHEASCLVKDYVYFNVDGIYVQKKDKETIENFFKSKGLEFETELCVKYSKIEYIHKGKMRKF